MVYVELTIVNININIKKGLMLNPKNLAMQDFKIENKKIGMKEILCQAKKLGKKSESPLLRLLLQLTIPQ